MRRAAQPDPIAPARKQRIVAQVCAHHQADRLQPHEVIVKANGEIWIDRRAKISWAVPFHIGNWS